MSVKIIKESTSKYPDIVNKTYEELKDMYDYSMPCNKRQMYNCYMLAKKILRSAGYTGSPEAIGLFGFGLQEPNVGSHEYEEIFKKIYKSVDWDNVVDPYGEYDFVDAMLELEDKDKYGEFGMVSMGSSQRHTQEFVVSYNEL